MAKLTASSIRGARRLQATTVKGHKLAEVAPVPVDEDGQPVGLWGAAAGYLVAEHDDFDDDDQALVDAVDDDALHRRGKLAAKDNTEREIRSKLKAEIAAKKKDRADRKAAREAAKADRERPDRGQQADTPPAKGGKAKAGR